MDNKKKKKKDRSVRNEEKPQIPLSTTFLAD